MSDAFTIGSHDLSGRIVELWRAGRPVHWLCGDEISRCGDAVQAAGRTITEDRRKEGGSGGGNGNGPGPKPVHVFFHDRFSGFYQGLPPAVPTASRCSLLPVALQCLLATQQQLQGDPKLSTVELPFAPADDLIVYFKSVDRRELEESPHTITLVRNCIQANMTAGGYSQSSQPSDRGKRMLILITPTLAMSPELPELKPEIVPLPDFATLRRVVMGVMGRQFALYDQSGGKQGAKRISEDQIDLITQACSGFTTADAEEAISLVWARHRAFDDPKVLDTLEQEKARIIARIPGVTYVPRDQIVQHVLPGYENLAHWVQERLKISRETAIKHGIKPIRGLAIGGAPGVGKTEMVKTLAWLMGRMLLLVNIGEIKGGIVGQSESNMRKVIQLLEAMHALGMFDDIDKGGIGNAHQYAGDGGTSGNMVQALLTAMSNPASDAVFAFTFNRIPDMPELLRPGRVDRQFYAERPNETTRLAILKDHAARAQMTCDDDGKLRLLAEVTRDWSGAELAHILIKDEVVRAAAEGQTILQVSRMLAQAQATTPQFAHAGFQQSIKEMEEACAQFTRVGNLPEEQPRRRTTAARRERSTE